MRTCPRTRGRVLDLRTADGEHVHAYPAGGGYWHLSRPSLDGDQLMFGWVTKQFIRSYLRKPTNKEN